MTFNETFFDFDAEETRLENEIATLEDEIEDLQAQIQRIKANDNDVPDAKRQALDNKVSKASKLDTLRKGVVWARDRAPESDDFAEWDEAVDGITLGAVRGRTLRRLQSEVRDAGETNGAEQFLYIADATVDAPYQDDELADGELASVVGDLHPWFLDWAEDRVDALMDPEGNATPSAHSPAETSTETDSAED